MYTPVEIAKYYKFSILSLFVDLHFYYHYKKNRKAAMSFNRVYLSIQYRAWGWCTGTTQRDGMGREEGGGFRMGITCVPVADSF